VPLTNDNLIVLDLKSCSGCPHYAVRPVGRAWSGEAGISLWL